MAKEKNIPQVAIKNRKAEFEYYLLTSFSAGLVLCGTEIKSGKSLADKCVKQRIEIIQVDDLKKIC